MTAFSEDVLFQNFDVNLQVKNEVHDTKITLTYAKKLRCIDHWISYNIKVVKKHMKKNYNKDDFEQKTNK